MKKSFLTAEQLALLELLVEPQSFEAIENFLKMDEKNTKHEINKLKYRGLIKETKGPTYDLWEITRKGKELLV